MDPTAFLDQTWSQTPIPRAQRQWHIDNQVFDLIMCKTCGIKPVRWSVKNRRYSTYCSSKCAHNDLDVKLKTQATCWARYGASTNLQTAATKNKIKATCLSKYGVENFAQSDLFRSKFAETCLSRYGVDNPSRLDAVKLRITQSHLTRYGRKRKSQCHIPEDTLALKNNKDLMLDLYHVQQKSVTEIAEMLNVNASQLGVHFKQNLGISITRHRVSKEERQVADYIRSLGFEVVVSDRSTLRPRELDILVPAANLAVEVNGLVWHSESRGKGAYYHLDKTQRCEQQGIRLIHLYDIEWNYQQDLVKSQLADILGCSGQPLAAKACKVCVLDSAASQEFFVKNHLQGAAPADLTLALIHNDQIACATSWRLLDTPSQGSWELLRYATSLGTRVPGGAERLFAEFLASYSAGGTVIGECDRRWSQGELLATLGFVHTQTREPRCWYTHDNKTLSLQAQLDNEDQPAKIWDCGTLVFEYRSSSE